MVNVVASVFDGDNTAAFQMGDHGNMFSAVAAQGKLKGIQILVLRVNLADDILLTFYCIS